MVGLKEQSLLGLRFRINLLYRYGSGKKVRRYNFVIVSISYIGMVVVVVAEMIKGEIKYQSLI